MIPPDDQPSLEDEDLFTSDLLLLLKLTQADEDREAVYGWLAEEYDEREER